MWVRIPPHLPTLGLGGVRCNIGTPTPKLNKLIMNNLGPGLRQQVKDPKIIVMSQPIHISLQEALEEGKRLSKIDNSVVHPMMKQQYTYKDLKAAFEEGVKVDSHKMVGTSLRFDKWFKSYKFELVK